MLLPLEQCFRQALPGRSLPHEDAGHASFDLWEESTPEQRLRRILAGRVDKEDIQLLRKGAQVPLHAGRRRLMGGRTMLEALILLCALSAPPNLAVCEETNAIYVMRLDIGGISPSTCARDAQAFIAGSSLLNALNSNGHLKVLCQNRRNSVAALVKRITFAGHTPMPAKGDP